MTVAVGNTITFPAETGTNIGNYTTVLSCLAGGGATANTLSGTNGQVSNTLVIGAGDSGKAIVCTYTNTRKTTTITLKKAWSTAAVNDTASVILKRGAATVDTLASTANTTTETDTDVTPFTANVGETLNLSETLGGANAGQYTATLACDNSVTVGGTGDFVVPATATNCTVTNTRQTATLQIAKAWSGTSPATDSATIGVTTGGLNNTTSFTTAGGTSANSGTAVTVAVGNTITFPAETGTNIGNYNTVLSCLAGGGATANTLSGTNGQVSNTLVIGAGDSGKAIVCTYTNTRKTTTITLEKGMEYGGSQ